MHLFRSVRSSVAMGIVLAATLAAPAARMTASEPAAEQTTPALETPAKAEPAKPYKPAVKRALVLRKPAATKKSAETKSGEKAAVETRVVAVAESAVPKSIQDAATTHKQSLIIKVNGDGPSVKLEDFCLSADGNVLALVSPPPQARAGGILSLIIGEATKDASDVPARDDDGKEAGKDKEKPKQNGSSVRVFDAAGKQAAEWSVGFLAQAINTAPDGTILVGGNGKVARYAADGKKLAEADSPQMEYIRKNAEEMRERAKEQIESQKEMAVQQVKIYEDQLKQLEEKKEADLTAQEKAQKAMFARQVKMMQTYAEQVGKKTIDQAVKEVTDRALRTHSICASDKDVFIVCPAMAGYGFGVWRTTVEFAEPKEIVKSLSGCCGQMDVQCHGGELFVAENSRHRVIRYNRDGKQVSTFGKRDRDGEGEGFGSCCNPMNTCFPSSGDLYVAESNGVVKHFTPDGKYVGVVGVAKVTPGCKNSAIGITADNSRLYYIDIEKSEIILLAKES